MVQQCAFGIGGYLDVKLDVILAALLDRTLAKLVVDVSILFLRRQVMDGRRRKNYSTKALAKPATRLSRVVGRVAGDRRYDYNDLLAD